MESKHQSFKNWITSEEPLAVEQSQELNAHLEACEECRQFDSAWHSIRRTMHAAEMVSPAIGFSARWQERQAADRLFRRKRQTRRFLAISVSIAALLFILLSIQVIDMLRNPETVGMVVLMRILSILSYAQATQEFLVSLIASLAKLPVLVYVLLVGFVSMLCVIWATAIQQLRRWPRVSGE
jgi:hypothetical protein